MYIIYYYILYKNKNSIIIICTFNQDDSRLGLSLFWLRLAYGDMLCKVITANSIS